MARTLLAKKNDDRRKAADRRETPTQPISRYAFSGHRQGPRRVEDREASFYVDRYGPRAVLLVAGILILSVADGFLTLSLVGLRGATEANPIMAWYLSFGPYPFLAVKYLITSGSVLLMVLHRNFRIFGGSVRIRFLLALVFCIYSLLIVYEIILYLAAPAVRNLTL